ncbi:tripartite tricarboxylate transporter TctB family protein [Paenalcaligenes hominis]|uniref:tripartite tricarboxylate transporter TctB family protein n=1 Tax=Paenalcaligenes hominis TaxID=643674 RepID=UPI00352533E4
MKTTPIRSVGEIAFSVFLLVFSLAMTWAASLVDDELTLSSAGSLPLVAASLMSICSLINLLRALRAPADFNGSAFIEFRKKVLPNTSIIIVGLILAFIFTLEYLGFNLASYLFLVLSSFMLGVKNRVVLFIIPALFLGCIHFIFQVIFSVILPQGSLWSGVFS